MRSSRRSGDFAKVTRLTIRHFVSQLAICWADHRRAYLRERASAAALCVDSYSRSAVRFHVATLVAPDIGSV
jgi:hypothetical protein